MAKCVTSLTNPGNYCKVEIDEIRRILFVSKYKEDGSINKILKTDADEVTNWQTLFDKYNFSSDVLEKVVPSPLVWGFTDEQTDNVVDDANGYLEKLADGDYNITFEHLRLPPYSIQQYKEMESGTVAVYFIDADNRLWGKDDSTYIAPVEVEGLQVNNFAFQTREKASKNSVSFRIKNSRDMNALNSILISDADVTSDEDFYSLIDATNTISSPATTGCVAVIGTSYLSNEGVAVAVTGIEYTAFTFVDQADLSTVTLAASGSLVESPDGTYTISEVALLTTAHTYNLQVAVSGYDIEIGSVVVP